MSADIIHEKSAAAVQRLTIRRDSAASHLSAHDRNTKVKASQIAEIEAAYIANATSEARGLGSTQDLPDANVLEKLRADLAVAEPVRLELSAKHDAYEKALALETKKHRSEISAYLRDTAIEPALAELQQAFDEVRVAAVKVMAAHKLAFHDFNDRRPPYRSANDISGPVAQWLAALHEMDWPAYPYDIRPGWLPRQGRFWPDEMSGVAERLEQLLAEVEQVSA